MYGTRIDLSSTVHIKAIALREHIEADNDRLAAFGKSARADIDLAAALGDADTADLFKEVSRAIDKQLWFVEAQIQTER